MKHFQFLWQWRPYFGLKFDTDFFPKVLFSSVVFIFLKVKKVSHIFFFNRDSLHARHGVTRKEAQKRLQGTENLFRKNLQLKDIC